MDLAEPPKEAEPRITEQASPDTSPFGDIPRSIWIAFLCAWALLFGLFVVIFARDGQGTMAVVTASFFALMTLGVPAVVGMQSKPRSHEWRATMETRSGPLPMSAAAVQILIIPVGAVIGLAVFFILMAL